MLAWAECNGYIMAALPELERERKKLPRQYIANVCYTIAGEDFAKWVNNRVEERNAKMTKLQDTIELDAEIAAIY